MHPPMPAVVRVPSPEHLPAAPARRLALQGDPPRLEWRKSPTGAELVGKWIGRDRPFLYSRGQVPLRPPAVPAAAGAGRPHPS